MMQLTLDQLAGLAQASLISLLRERLAEPDKASPAPAGQRLTREDAVWLGDVLLAVDELDKAAWSAGVADASGDPAMAPAADKRRKLTAERVKAVILSRPKP